MARIFQTESMGDAHIKIALVSERSRADLLVYRVSSLGLAIGDANWFITRDKQNATCWIYFTSEGLAQLKICFVNTSGEAGWQKDTPYKGRFR